MAASGERNIVVRGATAAVKITAGVVGAALALALWGASTVTMIGPAIQYFKSRNDSKLLEATRTKCIHSGEFSYVTTSAGNRLFVRFQGDRRGLANRKSIPIVIPNGLAATLMTISRLHEDLEAAGFTVVSFDRPGVGYSEPRKDEEPQPVDEVLQDMRDVMLACISDPATRWIVVGPSMGAIVGECFVAQYPDMVAGFVSLDGLSHSFDAQRDKFLKAAKMYSAARLTAWTGSLRVPMQLMAAKFSAFETRCFSKEAIQADMNRASFWGNTQKEFVVMMDLARRASERWGLHSICSLPRETVVALARTPPQENGDLLPGGRWSTKLRSNDEIGDDWLTEDEVRALKETLTSLPASPLRTTWARIPVAVLSARSYDYMGGDWYDPEMRLTAAAEHSSLVVLGLPGSVRFVFPAIGHDSLFLRSDALVLAAEHVYRLAIS